MRHCPPITLPRDLSPTALPGPGGTGADRSRASACRSGGHTVLASLARIALLSNGLLGRSTYSERQGRTVEYRTAGGTGALYHLEFVLDLRRTSRPDLAAGVYDYAANDHCLHRLRAGDYRRVLVEAAGQERALARGAGHSGRDQHLLAQCVVLPCASIPACLLGQRHGALTCLRRCHTALNLPAEVVLGYADAPTKRVARCGWFARGGGRPVCPRSCR